MVQMTPRPRYPADDTPLGARLCRVVARAAGLVSDEVTPSTRLGADLDLDDYDVLELLDAVEEAFGIEIPVRSGATAGGVETVGDIESLLCEGARSRRGSSTQAPLTMQRGRV